MEDQFQDQDQFELDPLEQLIEARLHIIDAIDQGNLESVLDSIEAGVPIPEESIILASDKNRTIVLEFLLRNTNIVPKLDD
jgi:hypothetical protein